MPLSKHHIDTQRFTVAVDWDGIKTLLQGEFPEVVFALVHGSSKSGRIGPHSDLDLAVFLDEPYSFAHLLELSERVSQVHEGVRTDLGILNEADPVYAFEALRGRLVHCRSNERYLRFFSETCRKYEEAMVSYERQRRYRMKVRKAVREQ